MPIVEATCQRNSRLTEQDRPAARCLDRNCGGHSDGGEQDQPDGRTDDVERSLRAGRSNATSPQQILDRDHFVCVRGREWFSGTNARLFAKGRYRLHSG